MPEDMAKLGASLLGRKEPDALAPGPGIMGVDLEGEGDEGERDEGHMMAARDMMRAIKADEPEAFLSALDDYLAMKGL